MSWEHTDISLAPRAGRADELRNEAIGASQRRELMRAKRSQRLDSMRSRLAGTLLRLADLITPADQAPAEALPSE